MFGKLIVFGDWRGNENYRVGDCRLERGFTTCSPPPQAVDIEEIAMHPQYEPAKHDYDIALAKMVRNVEFSEFVQPLCLPPAREIEGNHISRRLEMAGFARYNHALEEQMDDYEWRRKVTRHTTSLEFCNSASVNYRVTFTQNHLCGVSPGKNILMSGAPLMDVEVVDGKPRNFYLVGINTFGTSLGASGSINIDGFLRILPFRNWILKNIE
ncbi:transmembrane protease serine 9-like [Drosophila serrata]|uniref:transmembrane protease serine 9-like n=1 Tax=Drosophila serrata TaxID=7274 RepID=UPI000A1D26A9|nr:transmembrane protease serine 9-like [Drosophila serrata]